MPIDYYENDIEQYWINEKDYDTVQMNLSSSKLIITYLTVYDTYLILEISILFNVLHFIPNKIVSL